VLADANRARDDINGELADAQQARGASLVGAAQHGRYSGTQLRVGERLGEDVIRPAVEHPDPVKLIRPGAEDDHRSVRVETTREPAAGADRVDQTECVAVHVDHDDVEVLDREDREGLLAGIRRPDVVAVAGQVVGQEHTRSVILFCDQNAPFPATYREFALVVHGCAGDGHLALPLIRVARPAGGPIPDPQAPARVPKWGATDVSVGGVRGV
jgi:hypothetical protein